MPMFDFTLVISPPDVGFEEAADRLYGGGCWDGTFAMSQGVHEIVFSRKAASFREAVVSAVCDLAVAGIGSRVVRILIDDPPEEIDDADRIADAMLAEGLPGRFVDGLRDAAIWSRVLDLMVLWEQFIAVAAMADADEAVADLQDLLDDIADRPDGIVHKPMPDCRIVAGKIAALKADLEAKVELDATTAWNRLYAARASTDAAQKTLELSSEGLRAASVGYAAGVTPYLDFADAMDKNVAAAIGYLISLVEVKLAQVNLERAEGFPSGYPGDPRASDNPAEVADQGQATE